MEKLGASNANDLIMTAIVLNKLVQGLETEECGLVILPDLAVLHVLQERLQQGHDQGPEQYFDDSGVLLGYCK